MNLRRMVFFAVVTACFALFSDSGYAVGDVQSPPLGQVISAGAGDVKAGRQVQVPLITWGGDIATVLANGNSATTAGGSIFGQKGLKFKLFRQDDFKKQLEAYLSGETPFLRGTMGMLNMAADVISRDPRTRPIVIYLMTWSNGGDCLVVKPEISTAKDLKGKTVALQAYGPHVDYLAKILKDAGLSMSDVNIRWTKDLTGTDSTPVEAIYSRDVDAAFAIIPDGLMLTSNGAVGTGAEGSVKGAKIMLSTKTANRIIADCYAVRSDYFQAHRQEVESFVHGLMIASQQLKELFKNKESRMTEYKNMLGAAAEILLDSAQAAGDAESLYGDCEYAGFGGNVKFFGDEKWPRNLSHLSEEIQTAFISIGLARSKTPLEHAKWDYNRFRAGLTGVDEVASPKFSEENVAKVVAKKQAMGTLEQGELFSFEINFQPNQKDFSEDIYTDDFSKVIDLASTYGGAVITVEGHSDPQKYNSLEKKAAAPLVLRQTRQAAKNLSINRALSVRNSVIKFAAAKGIPLDESQFTVIGHGIDQPAFPHPETKEQWLSNMRVVFRIIQIEAEESVFKPVD
jgi:ABC-type nitrate/sulfonate/bicarbonate transport system substrate-binding protein/outer membrane protein OmpA-like peptidoglycan-associated protein